MQFSIYRINTNGHASYLTSLSPATWSYGEAPLYFSTEAEALAARKTLTPDPILDDSTYVSARCVGDAFYQEKTWRELSMFDRSRRFAIQVMGWRPGVVSWKSAWLEGGHCNTDFKSFIYEEDFRPYEDYAQAFMIVNAMRQRGFSFALFDVPSISSVMPGPLAVFKKGVQPPEFKDGDGYEGDGTIPIAICTAAWKAMGWRIHDLFLPK